MNLLFVLDHKHFVHFLKATFKPVCSMCTVTKEQSMPNMYPICPKQLPKDGVGQHAFQKFLRLPLAFECSQNHHDKYGSAPQLGPNEIWPNVVED